MSEKKKDVFCEDVNCQLAGFWNKPAPNGERLIHARARHNREQHIGTLKLAETTVQMIKRDKQFAEYFQKLLAA
ncbi:MAG: hypothetical protein M3367_02955 [Acidobacteriota bacterium]|nr:hypothetical protein [Acidobacteriota bacterium]